jgi:hypothetical protein
MSKVIYPLTRGVEPCVTKSGVQIGIDYVPPRSNETTREEDFWQDVILGIEPEWSQRRIVRAAVYIVFVMAILMTAYWKAKEVVA